MHRTMSAALLAVLGIAAAPAAGQIPERFTNLQVLPRDITRDSLVTLMRSFTFATGLRCEGCHVMGEGGTFQGARFDADDKPTKERARHMLRMVARLNEEILPTLPGRDPSGLRVECKTCHRGIRLPHLLRTELRAVVHEQGADAAAARYRELRGRALEQGTYDFGVWEMNELARQLEGEGRGADAAVMLELNGEFHPDDPAIPRELGALYERLGRTPDAVAAYRRLLELAPGDARAQARLRALGGG